MTRMDRIEAQLDYATSHIQGPITVDFTGQDLRYMVRIIRKLVNYIKNIEYHSDALGSAHINYLRDDLPDEVKELIVSD